MIKEKMIFLCGPPQELFRPLTYIWWGLGIALVFFAGATLIIDGFAERRARVYTEALSTFSAEA